MQRIHVRNERKYQILTTAGIGSAIAAIGALGTGSPAPLAGVGLGAILAAGGIGLAEHFHNRPDPAYARMMSPSGEMGEGSGAPDYDQALRSFYKNGRLDPVLAKVISVCAGTLKESVFLLPDFITVDDKREVVSFALQAAVPGAFTSEATLKKVIEAMNAVPVPGGAPNWRPTEDAGNDRLVFSGVAPIPDIAYPPLPRIAQSREESGKLFRGHMVGLGEAEQGKRFEYSIEVFAHALFVAPPGAGKSVLLRTVLEPLIAVGGICLLGDGKASDYAAYQGAPNIAAIGRGGTPRGMGYYAVIEIAYRLMMSRQSDAPERKQADPETWNDFPPIVLVLDEMKVMSGVWFGGSLTADEQKFIESRVKQFLALARELKGHAFIASQDAYAESIKTSWLKSIQMRVMMSRPESDTITRAVPPTLRPVARRVASGVDPNKRGRSMVVATNDEDSAKTIIQEFQAYRGYAPGEKWPKDERGRAEWERFKTQVSDKVPNLHSRMWFKIDEPSAAQRKQEGDPEDEDYSPWGYTDFDLYTPQEISELELVNLDMRVDGKIVPNPAMIRYDPDPLNKEYLGYSGGKKHVPVEI